MTNVEIPGMGKGSTLLRHELNSPTVQVALQSATLSVISQAHSRIGVSSGAHGDSDALQYRQAGLQVQQHAGTHAQETLSAGAPCHELYQM